MKEKSEINPLVSILTFITFVYLVISSLILLSVFFVGEYGCRPPHSRWTALFPIVKFGCYMNAPIDSNK